MLITRSCIARGTSEIDGKWSYETLLVLQFLFVGTQLPGEPYWLLKKGNTERARKCLTQIHGRRDESLIEAEMVRLQGVVKFSEDIKHAARTKGPLLLQCFQGTNLVSNTAAREPPFR